MTSDEEVEKIRKKHKAMFDKLEAEEIAKIEAEGGVTEEEAFAADSYLAKVYDRQEDELDDATLRGIKKGGEMRREREKIELEKKKKLKKVGKK